MQKKGSLSLSMNAIVVVVLAFSMLGLGLALTSQIFNSVKVPEQPNIKGSATANDPIDFPSNFAIKANGKESVDLSVYNKQSVSASQVGISITSCISAEDGEEVTGNLPTLVTQKQDIGASDSLVFRVIFSVNSNGTPAGEYLCVIAAKDSADATIASKQFTLQVRS